MVHGVLPARTPRRAPSPRRLARSVVPRGLALGHGPRAGARTVRSAVPVRPGPRASVPPALPAPARRPLAVRRAPVGGRGQPATAGAAGPGRRPGEPRAPGARRGPPKGARTAGRPSRVPCRRRTRHRHNVCRGGTARWSGPWVLPTAVAGQHARRLAPAAHGRLGHARLDGGREITGRAARPHADAEADAGAGAGAVLVALTGREEARGGVGPNRAHGCRSRSSRRCASSGLRRRRRARAAS